MKKKENNIINEMLCGIAEFCPTTTSTNIYSIYAQLGIGFDLYS